MSTPDLENGPALQNAIQLLIQTFNRYATNEEDKGTMSNAEFKEMLTTELDQSRNAQDKEAVDKVMGDLDSNNDGEVDFTKFIKLVSDMIVARHNSFVEHNKKADKKK